MAQDPSVGGRPQTGTTAVGERTVLASEVCALVLLTIADARGWVPLSRTPFLLLLCWISLRVRRRPWRDIGLARPQRFARAIVIGGLCGLIIELFAIFVTTPILTAVFGVPPDVSAFQPVVGNLQLLLLFVVLSWILAAFGEEIAFRGYLMTRAGEAFGRSPLAWAASLVLVSAYFGLGHGTQGLTGIAQESLSGFWLGLLFLASGRNLTIPIVAHGVANSLAFLLIYFASYPGLG